MYPHAFTDIELKPTANIARTSTTIAATARIYSSAPPTLPSSPPPYPPISLPLSSTFPCLFLLSSAKQDKLSTIASEQRHGYRSVYPCIESGNSSVASQSFRFLAISDTMLLLSQQLLVRSVSLQRQTVRSIELTVALSVWLFLRRVGSDIKTAKSHNEDVCPRPARTTEIVAVFNSTGGSSRRRRRNSINSLLFRLVVQFVCSLCLLSALSRSEMTATGTATA